jgi:predicted ATPase
VSLFEDPIFPDLADAEAFRADVAEVGDRRLSAYQDLVDLELVLGRHVSVLPELRAQLSRHPFSERLWAAMVLGLYRSGRQADALSACRDARRMFRDELGIDPGPALQQLEQEVLRQAPSLNAPVSTVQRRLRQRLDNLPAAITALVGRDAELEELRSLLTEKSTRLVTITGPGGVGKTHLALAAATKVAAGMTDGVCWVELASLTDPEQVAPAIAAALGVGDRTGDPMDNVTGFLSERRLLLVLDNFEQVAEAWPVVVKLLTACREVLTLMTSRRRLQIRGEYEFELGPLDVPLADSPLPIQVLEEVGAVRLFLTRGRGASRDFRLTAGNAATVVAICRRLDGLPLSIELVAAHLRHKTLSALATDLNDGLADLPNGAWDRPDRQRSLTATITWSYQLLDEAERNLFDRLGVFAGEPNVTAVHAVCSSGAESPASTELPLAALVEHSLVRRHAQGGEPRVTMLQSIRQFAQNKFAVRGDAPEVRKRHGLYFLSVAERLAPHLFGADQVEAVQLLKADTADLRAALAWASGPDGDIEVVFRLIGTLWHFWELTGDIAGPCTIAETVVTQTLAIDPVLEGPALSGTATLCWLQGRIAEAVRFHQQALEAFRRTGDTDGIGWSLMCLAIQAMEENDSTTATKLAEHALDLSRTAPHTETALRTQAGALTVLGLLSFYRGDPAGAEPFYEQSAKLARELGEDWLLGQSVVNLADIADCLGHYATAESLLHEALQKAQITGSQILAAAGLETLAAVHLHRHRPERGARLLAATAAYRSDMSLRLNGPERNRVETIIADTRAAAGPIRFTVAWTSGSGLTLAEAIDAELEFHTAEQLERAS